MSHEDVQRVVSGVVPCCHMEWPPKTTPALPWALYHGEDTPIVADDVQIAVRHRWTVELYEKRTDEAVEKALADALREEFGSVRREESWVENDNMLVIIFTFYQIEGEFDG